MSKETIYTALEAKRKKEALVKKRTPSWLTIEDSDQIKLLNKTARDLTENNTAKFTVVPIYPYDSLDVCGLHVPGNLIVMDTKHYKEGKTQITKGTIGIEELLAGKAIRYKGKFLKGLKQESKKTKKLADSMKEKGFKATLDDLRAKHKDNIDEIIKEVMFMASDREEFLKYADKFLPYYKPKLQSIETKATEDRTIKIEIVGLEDDKAIDSNIINITPELIEESTDDNDSDN